MSLQPLLIALPAAGLTARPGLPPSPAQMLRAFLAVESGDPSLTFSRITVSVRNFGTLRELEKEWLRSMGLDPVIEDETFPQVGRRVPMGHALVLRKVGGAS